MNRLSEIEIAGKKLPLNFSAKAVELFENRYNGLSEIEKVFKGKSTSEQLKEVIWMLSVMIEQGAVYKKVVDKEDIEYFTEEELEIVLGIQDFAGLQDQIMLAMSAGSATTVETEDDPKNAKTTQSK